MNKQELVIEQVYFIVSFHDKNLLIPEIKTYIFLGESLLDEATEAVTFFFQGAEQFIELGRWEQKKDAVEFDVLIMKEDFLEYVFDYSGLQDQIELMKKGGANYYP